MEDVEMKDDMNDVSQNKIIRQLQMIDETEKEKLNEFCNKKLTVNDFTTLKVIGKGSYGTVLLVEKKDDKKIYAMKILKKKAMIKRNQVNHIKAERKIILKIQIKILVPFYNMTNFLNIKKKRVKK